MLGRHRGSCELADHNPGGLVIVTLVPPYPTLYPPAVLALVIKKPAQPAKKGVPNPFRPGELMDVAAKPAKNVVKVRPLKNLKAMA